MKNSPERQQVFVSRSLANTAQFAQQIATSLAPSGDNLPSGATILALSGDLGAGKTAFVKALASALGITETITSPTFVIEQIYVLPKDAATPSVNVVTGGHFDRLIHIDAYRLEKASELERLGWAEIASDPKNLICLEWPENVVGISHFSDARKLQFRFIDESTREISFE